MKYCQGLYPIIRKENPAAEVYGLVILCPEIAAIAKCGQFVNIRIDGFTLRRPVSICEIDRQKGTLRIVFQIRGKGTDAMSLLNPGDLIDMVAPLGGRGFTLQEGANAIIIGGGIGNPPMLELAKFYGGNATVISGFRNAAAVILQEDFKSTGAKTFLCTNDGTAGEKGFVTDILGRELQTHTPDIICACGPMPMLKGVAAIAKEKGIRSEVSLEERMGCGVGGCLVCACRTVKDGEEIFAHVCKDGPVFDSKEVFPNE
ncbi:MAG: dihydroorotate dehydrogenase electron transfer subunit [Oscillospiraceae bacterium]|nr:dihydroorotate dehydrogenase electron transfer subunit [Oscillospiraceae bacterium]